MRDVGERPCVHEAGLPLERLNQVRFQRLLENHGHRARSLEVIGRDRLALVRVANGDRAETPTEVMDVPGHGDDGHDLRGRRDVESRLTRIAVGPPAEPHGDLPQRPVVHVQAAPPADRQRVDAEPVPVQHVRLEGGGEEVVRSPDRMDISGEMEVEVLHRHDLGVAAAGRSPLDSEHGTQRGLAEAEDRIVSELAEPLGE